jgi:hypothetical protein
MMDRFSEMRDEIAELLDDGYKASTVAAMLKVPLELVNDVLTAVDEGKDDYYDDGGDTDDAYALQSAGFGTDEDYGYYGEE